MHPAPPRGGIPPGAGRAPLARRGARWTAWLLALSLAGCADDGGAIRGSGTIEMDEIDVGSLVGGRLVRLAVVEGDTVRAGDTLAVLDRGEIAAELASQAAQAERAESQARDLVAYVRAFAPAADKPGPGKRNEPTRVCQFIPDAA